MNIAFGGSLTSVATRVYMCLRVSRRGIWGGGYTELTGSIQYMDYVTMPQMEIRLILVI